MDNQTLWERRVGKSRLELVGIEGVWLAAIHFQSEDKRFERGGFDIVVELAALLLEEVAKSLPFTKVLWGPFEPVTPANSRSVDAVGAAYRDLEARLKAAGRPASLGPRHPVVGTELGLQAATSLLREIASKFSAASAEESRLRFVLLAKEEEDSWDLLHRFGSTQIGRWNGNVQDRPGSFDRVVDSPVAQAALATACRFLERRLGA